MHRDLRRTVQRRKCIVDSGFGASRIRIRIAHLQTILRKKDAVRKGVQYSIGKFVVEAILRIIQIVDEVIYPATTFFEAGMEAYLYVSDRFTGK